LSGSVPALHADTGSAPDCLAVSAKMSPAERRPARVSRLITEGSRDLSAQPSYRIPYGAVVSGARSNAPAPTAQPRTGQVADQIANTPRNTWIRPPQLCYFYCMISPIRGDLPGFRVQVPRTR
jgi:hypothetical protein